MCFNFTNYKCVKDMSSFESPVQAAHYLHNLKNYDNDIGKFKYNDQVFVINNFGYYVIK
jgi:hypothetical protein